VKLNNKISQVLEYVFNPVQLQHTKLNDFLYRKEIQNIKFNDNLKFKATITPVKIFYDNLFKAKGKLSLHFVIFKPTYSVIDNTVSTIFKITNLANVSIPETFVSNAVSDNSDYYLKFENIPKYEMLRKIRGDILYLTTAINTYQEELRVNKQDSKAERLLKESQSMLKLLQYTQTNIENDINSTVTRFNVAFRKKYENSDFTNVIQPEYENFRHSIQQQGHILEKTTNRQQFTMFDYINTLDPVTYMYYIYSVNDATGHLYPFVYPSFINSDKVIFGNYIGTGQPILKDLWDLDSQNGIIIGMMGSGKSATSKAFLTRNLIFKNRKIIIIDPQAEYLYVTKMVGGEYINVLQENKKSQLSLNIFDKADYEIEDKGSGTAFSLKINDIADFIALTVTTEKHNELKQEPIYNQFLTTLIISFYNSKNIYSITDITNETVPTLNEFIAYIDAINKTFNEKNELHLYNKTYTAADINFSNYKKAFALITSACETLKLPEYSMFMGKTNINLSNKFIAFNTAGLPEKLQILVTYVIMNYVIKTMKTGLTEDKIFLIDEGWKVLSMLGSQYIKIIAKTARKFRLGLIITTQQIKDFDSDEGRALVENIQFAYLYRIQGEDSVMNSLKQLFKLNDDDIYFLKNYAGSNKLALTPEGKAARGILRFKDDNYRIKFMLTKNEVKFSESNPDSLLRMLPVEIINNRKKIEELETEITAKKEQGISSDYEEKLISYYSLILDTLRDIKSNIERSVIAGSSYDEEQVRNFVIKDAGIYSLDSNKEQIFGEGINIDESIYLLKNGYKEVQASPELEEIFGPEMFYVKSSLQDQIAIYNKFLIEKIKREYSNLLLGDIIEEQNDISFRIKEMKTNGSFYVYVPSTDSTQLWTIENENIKIEPSPKKDYFSKSTINNNFIYVHNIDTNKEIIYPQEQENFLKEKILYNEKRIQIRVLSEYFTQFSNQTNDIANEKIEQYYVLFTDLYNTKSSSGLVPKNIFRFNEYLNLFHEIFS